MKIMESQTGQLFYGNKEYATFSEGSPKLYKDKAIPMAQKIHDALIGQGFTYMHCWLILHLVESTLREERDIKSYLTKLKIRKEQQTMTKLEYKKIEMERRRKSRELLDKAKAAGFDYPHDLHYLWDFMQDKEIGLPYCLGMIYNLGLLAGREEGGQK